MLPWAAVERLWVVVVVVLLLLPQLAPLPSRRGARQAAALSLPQAIQGAWQISMLDGRVGGTAAWRASGLRFLEGLQVRLERVDLPPASCLLRGEEALQ